jgi:hypothetical protein
MGSRFYDFCIFPKTPFSLIKLQEIISVFKELSRGRVFPVYFNLVFSLYRTGKIKKKGYLSVR